MNDLGTPGNPLTVRIVTQIKAHPLRMLFLAAVTFGPILWQLKESNPAALARVQMRMALTVKRFADVQADAWSAIATRAATAYQHARLS